MPSCNHESGNKATTEPWIRDGKYLTSEPPTPIPCPEQTFLTLTLQTRPGVALEFF